MYTYYNMKCSINIMSTNNLTINIMSINFMTINIMLINNVNKYYVDKHNFYVKKLFFFLFSLIIILILTNQKYKTDKNLFFTSIFL